MTNPIKLPVTQGTSDGMNPAHLFDGAGTSICELHGLPTSGAVADVPDFFDAGKARAEFIKLALNNHEILVKALQSAYRALNRLPAARHYVGTLIDIEAALGGVNRFEP